MCLCVCREMSVKLEDDRVAVSGCRRVCREWSRKVSRNPTDNDNDNNVNRYGGQKIVCGAVRPSNEQTSWPWGESPVILVTPT